jgi:hypothetical protein
MNKIIKITKKVPEEAVLPDGTYGGVLGGYIIEVTYKNDIYHLEIEEGIRGMGFKVMVIIIDGKATYEFIKN